MARRSEPWWRESRTCYYVWHDGKLKRLHPDRDEAYRRWHLLLAGSPPLQQTAMPPLYPDAPTVSALVDAYLADAELRLKPSTVQTKRKILLRLKSGMGRHLASALKPSAVSVWLSKQTSWGRSLRWLAGKTILALCQWAVGQGLLPINPAAGLKLPGPLCRSVAAIASAEDHAKLLAAAPQEYRNALTALHATGCRPGELCSVEACHFDATAGAWVLPQHKTDGMGKARVILLPPSVVALCTTLAEEYPQGALFRDCHGNPLTPDRLRLWIRKACRRLGLPRITAYGYRHGFATDALVSGVPDAHVAALLGHSSTAMLHRHYSHLTARTQALRTALEQVRA